MHHHVELVTGATGYVGSRLARRLARAGRPVRALSRDPSRLEPVDGVEAVEGDLLAGADLARVLDGCETAYYLVHSMEAAAGVIVGRFSQKPFQRTIAKTLEGVKLSEAMSAEKIFPSSMTWTVRQGELAGNLPEAVLKLADRYDAARDFYFRRSLKILEVGSITIMTCGIGYYAVRVYTMVFNLASISFS